MRLAVLTLVFSTALACLALDRAVRVPPLPSAGPVDLAEGPPAFQAAIAIDEHRLAAALEKNPFHPERRRPTIRFRMPGEPIETAASAPASEAVPFRLVGTAVMSEGRGFAMCERGDESPRLVRIGERIGDFTLRTVAQGKAVFVAADGKPMELRVAKAGT